MKALNKILKFVVGIREFFWPLLEKQTKFYSPKTFFPKEILVNSENLEVYHQMILKSFEDEHERSMIVERKASLFVGFIGIVTTLAIAATTILIERESGIEKLLLSIILTILMIYLVRTLWFSIKTLERRGYAILSLEDYELKGDKEEFYKKLICQILNATYKNTDVINKKVNFMVMAQEYFKRVIGTFVLYIVFLTVQLIYNYSFA